MKRMRMRVKLVCGYGRLVEPGTMEAYDVVCSGWTWCFKHGLTEAVEGWTEHAFAMSYRLITNVPDRLSCLTDAASHGAFVPERALRGDA